MLLRAKTALFVVASWTAAAAACASVCGIDRVISRGSELTVLFGHGGAYAYRVHLLDSTGRRIYSERDWLPTHVGNGTVLYERGSRQTDKRPYIRMARESTLVLVDAHFGCRAHVTPGEETFRVESQGKVKTIAIERNEY
jgi:hypothetical protein